MVDLSLSNLDDLRNKMNLIPFFSIVLFYYAGVEVNSLLAVLTIVVSVGGEAVAELLKKSVKTSKEKKKKLSEVFRKDMLNRKLSDFKDSFNLNKKEMIGFVFLYMSLFLVYIYTMWVSFSNEIFYWFAVQIGILVYGFVYFILYPRLVEK